MGTPVGSVTAEIILDSKEFNEAITKLKEEVTSLKDALKSAKGLDSLNKDVAELKEKVNSLTETNKHYRDTIKNLREENEKLAKSLKDGAKAFKEEQTALDTAAKSAEKYLLVNEKIGKRNRYRKPSPSDFSQPTYNVNPEIAAQVTLETMKNAYYEYDRVVRESAEKERRYWATTQSNMRNAAEAYVGGVRNMVIANRQLFATEGGYNNYINTLSRVRGEFEKVNNVNFTKLSANVYENGQLVLSMGQSWSKTAAEIYNSTTIVKVGLKEIKGEMEYVVEGFYKVSDVLKTFNYTLLESATGMSKAHKRALELASAMHKMNVQGTENWQGRNITGGYNTYLTKSLEIMEKLRQETIKLKIATGELGSAYKSNGINLNTYKSNLTGIQKEMDRLTKSAQRVKNAQLQLQYFQRTDWLNQYKGNMGEINAQLEKQVANLDKTGANARNAGKGITTFNDGIVKTAHSGRILSNTLYQIRGALLSVKMIATAMGGMMVWDFAMQIAEGIKTTFTAKNELESQLKQNAKVGASGLETFNRALDKTISKFQKVNKYQLGETVSSLGVEFELTSKQMEKAMPVVAMIQSEYIRAGRTSEEAALAVKDILQGEFQRLSRETGVGKEELLAYGWNGDKTDIESLLDAVKKAGEDRNWDVFAAKATSLNDVIEITKNRFEEFGADLLQTISPAIVSGFNTILDTVSGLQKAFNGLGSFGKNMAVGGGILAGMGAIGTLLPMVTKGMGLADIATIGWGKSLLTAALNLNKAEVAQYGFRKALAAVITGTKASELANVRTTKSIMGRILGLNQATLAEHGYLTSLVAHRMELKGLTPVMTENGIQTLKWYQKLGYLSGGLKESEVATAGLRKSLLNTATAFKVLKTAIIGIGAVALIGAYTSLATWADTVKKNISALNEVIDNGKDMLKDARKDVTKYTDKLNGLTKGTKEYIKTKNDLDIATATRDDIKAANELAKTYKEQNKEAEKNIANRHKHQMALSYRLAGLDETKSKLRASGWEEKVRAGEQNWIDSMNIYNDRLYKSNQHINEHIRLMKEANVPEKDRLKYIDEYSAKAEEVADRWKQFNQGDLTAGVYAVIGEIQLMWIDLWNDKHFINFWNSVKKTWEDIKPTVYAIKDALGDIGHLMMDFFSTDGGKIAGGIALAGGAFAFLGTKLYHVLGGTKSTWDIMKKLGGTLKDRIKDWKGLGDKAEEANEKMGGTTSTGGIKGGKDVSFGGELKDILKNRVKSFVNNALLLAELAILITEAIYLIQAPMWALAETGKTFKAKEKSIQAGIDGLKLIAPTVIAILIPIMALMKIMDMWGSQIMNVKTIVATAAGIVVGIGLVTEAIIMLKAPMWALAQVGNDFKSGIVDIKNGVTAMKYVGDSLKYLAPFIPAFILGITLVAATIATDGVGGVAILAVAGGIALGMLLIAEAVVTLRIPLEAIRELGNSVGKLDGVQKGAEALKVTAEAMMYVDSALGSLVKVQWEMIAANIGSLLGVDIGNALDDLVKDGDGFLAKLNDFAKKFNEMEFTPVAEDKAASLKNVAESLGSIDDALESAKKAIDNLPAEFKNGGNGQPLLSYDMETGTTAVTGSATGEDVSGYFDQLKQPLEELGKFITWFNDTLEFPSDGIDEGKLDTISQSADMVTRVNDAVNKVKEAMGNIGMGNIATNFAQMTGGTGGIPAIGGIGAIANLWGAATGGGGTGDYQSSLGSQLYEMEKVLNDLATFNSKISTIGSGDDGSGGAGAGGNVEALSGMVTAVSDAISKLESTLSQAVPTIKQSANDIGTGIRNGVKTGIGDLTQIVVPPLVNAMNAMKANAYTYGKGVGERGRSGFKETFKVADTVNAELGAALTAMENKKQEFYDKGFALGDAAARGFKDGDKISSPGIIAHAMFDELAYVSGALDDAINTMPEQTYTLSETMANNFNPSLDIGGISVGELAEFQSGLDNISYMASATDMQTSTAFQNMNMNVGTSMVGMTGSVNGAFTNIKQNATTSYAQLTNTTKVSLKNMQDQTIKNINNIKTSWRGMQNALIASAENIRSQTGQKIQQLESNMASFWRKVQNPANLLGAAGSSSMVQHTRPQRRSGRMAAGGASSVKLPKVKSRIDSSYIDFREYLKCLMEDGVCMAGSGWRFNWAPDIQRAFMKWDTHFNKYNLDAYLKVGKFEHDDFPVRGIASVAKDYIFDAISQTSYSHYYNEKYGSPLEAWNAGSFNCVDGARVAIALADAFGFGGGYVAYGTWNGEGHGFAVIPGLGVIDATAIQQRGSLTAPGTVKGYPAGGSRTMNSSSPKAPEMGNTIEGNVVFNINVEGNADNPDELGRQIGETASKTFIDMFKRSNATGR